MQKRFALPCLALIGLLAAIPVFAQTSAALPKADGMVSAGEYRFTKTASDITLGVTLSADGKTLYVSVQAPTTGWVAFGVGSLKMNGAFMVLAYDANGAPTISEQTGKGHSHSPNAASILTAGAVKETNGVTTLEAALPASSFVTGDTIKFIAASGRADNLTSMHRGFFPAEVPVSQAK